MIDIPVYLDVATAPTATCFDKIYKIDMNSCKGLHVYMIDCHCEQSRSSTSLGAHLAALSNSGRDGIDPELFAQGLPESKLPLISTEMLIEFSNEGFLQLTVMSPLRVFAPVTVFG